MSKYNGLNYSANFLNLVEKHGMSSLLSKQERAVLFEWVRDATVFELPPEGYALGQTSLEGLIDEELSLPFPLVALEFPTAAKTIGAPAQQIILAAHISRDVTQLELPDGVGIDASVLECFEEHSDLIVLHVLLRLPIAAKHSGAWVISPYRALMPTSAAFRKKQHGPNATISYQIQEFYDVLIEETQKQQKGPETLALYKEVTREACFQLGSFLEALACPTVHIKTARTVDEAVNRRRAKKGKLPLHEIKILNIELPKITYERVNRGGTHASPRLHIRRKHPRTLPSGRVVTVRQCIVGKASAGTIDKTYTVNKTIWDNGEDK